MFVAKMGLSGGFHMAAWLLFVNLSLLLGCYAGGLLLVLITCLGAIYIAVVIGDKMPRTGMLIKTFPC